MIDPPPVQIDDNTEDAALLLDVIRRILLDDDRAEMAALRTELARLEAEQADPETSLRRIRPLMSELVGRTIRESPDAMAEALGPIMGDAIRVQIRDSRDQMVEALYPIIGQTVQRAVLESMRELQRNIDARLRGGGFMRSLQARLRGVDPASLALRDALPFTIEQLFLIQRGSGLLIHQATPGDASLRDPDLASGMLSAIRDFAHDGFGPEAAGADLDAIDYGDFRILIEDGSAAFAAVVLEGVEPEGFHAALREFLSDLHLRYERPLRAFTGDPSTLPDFEPQVRAFLVKTRPASRLPAPLTTSQRTLIGGTLGLAAICLVGVLFYARFTWALLPVAFPGAVPSPTLTVTATATATASPSPQPSITPSLTPAATLTASPAPSATPAILSNANVWAQSNPLLPETAFAIIPIDTPLNILSSEGLWLEVTWRDPAQPGGVGRGWVPAEFVARPESNAP